MFLTLGALALNTNEIAQMVCAIIAMVFGFGYLIVSCLVGYSPQPLCSNNTTQMSSHTTTTTTTTRNVARR